MQKDPFRATLDAVVGSPNRPLDYGKWWAPAEVQLENDELVWPANKRFRRVRHASKVLEEFVNLEPGLKNDDAENILRFSRRWGVMEVCSKHGVPASHNPPRAWMDERDLCHPALRLNPPMRSEPVAFWRTLILQFRHILQVCATLHCGNLPKRADIMACSSARYVFGEPPLNRADIWRVLLGIIGSMVNDSDIRVVPFLPNSDSVVPRIRLMGSGLYSALVTELIFAICQTDGLAICNSCGAPFVPARKPRAQERTYCERCRTRRKTPIRDAVRAYRKRIHDTAELSGAGLSVAEIAEELSLPIKTVNKYLQHVK